MKRPLVAVFASLLVLSLLLTACGGGGDGPAPQPTAAPKATTAPSSAPAAKPTTAPAPAAKAQPTAAAKPSTGQAAPATAAPAAKPAAGGPQRIATAQMPKFLRIKGSADPSGTYAHISIPLVKNLESVFPEVRVRDIPGGSREGIERIDKGEVDLGVIGQADAYAAWMGITSKGWSKPVRSFRLMFSHPVFGGLMNWGVPGDSPVKSVKDLANKRINPGLAGYSSTPGFANIFKLYGVGWDTIASKGGTVYWGNPSDGWGMVSAGKLDAAIVMVAPYAPVVQYTMTRSVRILPYTAEEQAAFCDPLNGAGGGYIPGTLAANTYKGQTQDVASFNLVQGLVVRADMPDDVVYNMMWALFSDGRNKVFQDIRPGYEKPDVRLPDNGTKGMTVPLHPGAAKFFKDLGIAIPKALSEK